MNEWIDCSLGDVLTLQRGFDLPSGSRRAGKVPVVSSAGITGVHDEARVSAPGVVIGRYGTLGEVHYVQEDFWPLNTTLWVKDFKGNHPHFCAYMLETIGIADTSGSAAVPGVNRNVLHGLPVCLPPIETQRRIASILGAYDDLIEVNRRRIAVLEEMARGLFEEWFVRFRFPGHEAVPILDTPDGQVPAGWGQAAFGSLLEHTIGGLWGEASQSDSNDQRVSVVRGTDFPKLLAGNYAAVPDRFVSSRELASRAFLPGDLILEASGGSKDQPVGRILYVTASLIEKLGPPVAPASFCRLLRPNDKCGSGAYLYGLLKAMYQDKRIEKFQKQSTGLRNLSMKQLAAETVTVPNDAILKSFGKVTIPLLEAASLHRHESKALSASRDLLLPRLISGQLSVAQAERQMEEAA